MIKDELKQIRELKGQYFRLGVGADGRVAGFVWQNGIWKENRTALRKFMVLSSEISTAEGLAPAMFEFTRS